MDGSVGTPLLWIRFTAFILGLRSMYFLLAGIMDRFRYLKMGLGAVLVFVGTKMGWSTSTRSRPQSLCSSSGR